VNRTRWSLLLSSFGVLLILSTQLVFAQADQELDALLQLYWGIAAEKAVAGVKSTSSLQNIRDLYAKKLDDMVTVYQNRGVSTRDAQAMRNRILKYLDARISIARDQENTAASRTGVIHQTITDGANSIDPSAPPEPNPIVTNYHKIQADQLEDHAAHQVNTTVIHQIPDSISVVQSTSVNRYDFDAGLPPSSSIAAEQDDDDVQPTELPVPTPTFSTVIQSTPSENGGSAVSIQKPLRFSNKGNYAATVIVASYTRPRDSSVSKSSASTVVFPSGNTSSSLTLPIGEYTFCYYWELDGDADNDGYVDYAHATTGKVTLSATSSDSVGSAQVVSLNPEDRSSPNGKCSEPEQPPSGAALNLTPQEAANQGENTYLCSYEDWGEDTSTFEIQFFDNSIIMDGPWLTEAYTGTKLSPNIYLVDEDTITFTDDGFLAENESGVLTCVLQ